MTIIDNQSLSGLAERVERASGADRELDEAIADAIFTEKRRTCIAGLSGAEGGMWMWRHPDGSIGSALRFTQSVDAAMTLHTAGTQFTLSYSPMSRDMGGRNWHAQSGKHRGHGRTPSLALAAASLRSLAQTQEME